MCLAPERKDRTETLQAIDANRSLARARFVGLVESRPTPGSGLGLSLVAAVADLHGIAISLIDNEPAVRVELNFAPGATA